ncbi:hypothetical protein OG500_35390 [Kitasatospora sp. NBC_01250]|uniref:hypothetical protein n=1 Tax=unclassified Kitasatospora TaxID=2633591 RepID=UPI002E0DECA0|nr:MULTISPECIES: hypothetical protein [unclassified Kitasatospora]WSJ71231.1 hypothetical protein OG294_36895 [Kitasatospora sp. NBC_01302]
MHPTGPVAQRFPLIPRIRPACLPLDARVGRLCELADTGSQRQDPSLASTVFNQTALLASDLGLPDYARALCHRHAGLYLTLGPLPAMSAIRGLEPLVNLARLHLRAGRHDQGHRLLLDLYHAVTAGTATVLDGITVPADLTETDQQRTEVRTWLWRVVLADGTRALTAAGRWTEALRHIENHRGIGQRILDGRQVAVLARATTGDTAGALSLLETTEPGDPWEGAVTAVLTALLHPEHQPTTTTAIDHVLALEPGKGLAVFTTRLTLSAIDAADQGTSTAARDLAAALISRTLDPPDGYAARELLAHPACRTLLTATQGRGLSDALTACGLGDRRLPTTTRTRLRQALALATDVLRKTPLDQEPQPAGRS